MLFQSHITLGGHLNHFFKVVRLIFSLQNENYRTLIAGFHYHFIKIALFFRGYLKQPTQFTVARKREIQLRRSTRWDFKSQCNNASATYYITSSKSGTFTNTWLLRYRPYQKEVCLRSPTTENVPWLGSRVSNYKIRHQVGKFSKA